MNSFTKLFLISTLILIYSCGGRIISKEEAKENALLITEKLNEENINVFRKWNFEYRGGEIWTKKIDDSTVYSCYYRKDNDTISLVIRSRFLSSNEFPCLIDIDTSIYRSYNFKQSKDGRISVIAKNKDWEDTLLLHNQNIENIFGNKNPISKVDSLSKAKDELKVYRINYLKRNGDFIDFYISARDILTYIADESTLKPNQRWLDNFAKGIEIKPKWNLRQFDEDQYD